MSIWETIDPWTALRREKAANEYLRKECERLDQERRDAQREAFHNASEYYYNRMRNVERQMEALQAHAANLAALTPRPLVVSKDLK